MKKSILFVLACYAFLASAQTDTEIRNYYTSVNKQITESIEKGFEGPLYNNQWVANKNVKSWPAVGLYSETIDFWYDDPPDHISADERNPATVLLKVNIIRKAAHLTTNEEYLYKGGKLIFYYSNEMEEGHQRETRLYFNAKGLFKSIVKTDGKELTTKDLASNEYADLKPDSQQILKYGKKYQDLFVKSML